MIEENIVETIIDWDGNGNKVSVVESTDTPWVYWVVVVTPDWSNL